MSNVPPPKPANTVVVIDGDMPWGSVFRLTWRFSVASLLVWLVLSLPFLAIMGVSNYFQAKADMREKVETQEQVRQAYEAIQGAMKDAEQAGKRTRRDVGANLKN